VKRARSPPSCRMRLRARGTASHPARREAATARHPVGAGRAQCDFPARSRLLVYCRNDHKPLGEYTLSSSAQTRTRYTSSENLRGGNPCPFKFALAPLFFQVLLVFILMFWMALKRNAVRRGEVHPREHRASASRMANKGKQIANSFSNQFESPVLFILWHSCVDDAASGFVIRLLSGYSSCCRYIHASSHDL